jgi:hypothetical protein
LHSKYLEISMPEQTVQNEPQAQTQPQGLTLQDLVLVAQIIQMSTSKGVFRAEDLLQVGSLYTRLIAFLESTGAISKTPPAPPEAPPEPAPVATNTKEKSNAKARR